MTGPSAVPNSPPHLDLAFRHHPIRGTWLERRMFRWPYALARGFRLESRPAGMLTLIVQTVSGAIQADDRLVQHIQVGRDAASRITTQGATPVYRAPTGLRAVDEIALDVADGGCLEYLPEPRILFPQADLSQRLQLCIAESATAIIADGFVMHDPEGRERPFHGYRAETILRRSDGSLLALDRLCLDTPVRNGGRRARYVAHGTLLVATSRPEQALLALCADAEAGLVQVPGVYAGASLLPNAAGASFRLAAIDGRHLRLGLQIVLGTARRHLFGCDPQRLAA